MLRAAFGTIGMLKECVSMSLSNILNNRVRSFLTVLGIMIGVTAVIALITTVSGVSGSLSSSFSSMGAGTLMVNQPVPPFSLKLNCSCCAPDCRPVSRKPCSLPVTVYRPDEA